MMWITRITIENGLDGTYVITRSDGVVLEGLSESEVPEQVRRILEEKFGE